MLNMTQKTIKEAQTVKTITIVALIYIPATFTAVRARGYFFPSEKRSENDIY